MNKVYDYLQVVFSLIGGFIVFLIGDFNEYLKLLMLLNIIDFLTGIFKGFFIEKNIDSNKIYYGGFKKALIYIVIIIANRIDNTFQGVFLRETSIIYYIINESVSIFENISIHIDVPTQIGQYFNDLKELESKKGYDRNDDNL